MMRIALNSMLSSCSQSIKYYRKKSDSKSFPILGLEFQLAI